MEEIHNKISEIIDYLQQGNLVKAKKIGSSMNFIFSTYPDPNITGIEESYNKIIFGLNQSKDSREALERLAFDASTYWWAQDSFHAAEVLKIPDKSDFWCRLSRQYLMNHLCDYALRSAKKIEDSRKRDEILIQVFEKSFEELSFSLSSAEESVGLIQDSRLRVKLLCKFSWEMAQCGFPWKKWIDDAEGTKGLDDESKTTINNCRSDITELNEKVERIDLLDELERINNLVGFIDEEDDNLDAIEERFAPEVRILILKLIREGLLISFGDSLQVHAENWERFVDLVENGIWLYQKDGTLDTVIHRDNITNYYGSSPILGK